MTPPTYADDCERVIRHMADATVPETLDAIAAATGMPLWHVSKILCDLRLRGRVTHTRDRVKSLGKVDLYALRTQVIPL